MAGKNRNEQKEPGVKEYGRLGSIIALLIIVIVDAVRDNYEADPVVYVVLGLMSGAEVRELTKRVKGN